MDFTKLQGAGNDFILIDARDIERDWPTLARQMCDRHFGVGADGILLALPSDRARLRLRMFNPDGSEAEACGNGLRCFSRYIEDNGLVDSINFSVETMAGMREVYIHGDKTIQVTMGAPVLNAEGIPVVIEHRDPSDVKPILDYPIRIDNTDLLISCVSIGNPHAVCFLSQPVVDFPLKEIGPKVEHHPMFPNRVNFEVANAITRDEIEVRVWERGAGETLACGSGACAVAVISRLKGLSNDSVDILVPGGRLTVDWNGNGEVSLRGPAETVFHGTWNDQPNLEGQ